MLNFIFFLLCVCVEDMASAPIEEEGKKKKKNAVLPKMSSSSICRLGFTLHSMKTSSCFRSLDEKVEENPAAAGSHLRWNPSAE